MEIGKADEQQRQDRFYIGGEWVAPSTDARFTVYNAATEEPFGSTPEGAPADIDRAVAAARAALDGEWGSYSPSERSAVLLRFADEIAKRGSEIAATISVENGMPIGLSTAFEADGAVGILQYYAALAARVEIEERRPSPAGYDSLVRRDPVGVVAGIVPWNYPVSLAITKIGPALAAGCTIVLKPSPGTPLDSYFLAESAAAAGIPAGVINWVPADREVGAYLVAHPGVDKVAFTGSTAAGRDVGAVCGGLVRPVSLELGGKSAAIVLDDANIAEVIEGLGFASFANNGQTCAASTRILVAESIYDEFIAALGEWADSLPVGDPLDPATVIGPLASRAHRDRVAGLIDAGIDAGIPIITERPRNAGRETGWFIAPTVFADTPNSSRIAQEEIFGPVLVVIKVSGDNDAVRVANDSEYGLAGTVWSADATRAKDVARQIVTGTIGVNGWTIDVNAPFGGVKASGIGREFGPESLAGYQQLKSIYLPVGD